MDRNGATVLPMAFIAEQQSVSTGFPGAPGYTNLYFLSTVLGPWELPHAATVEFFTRLQTLFPAGWNVHVPSDGKILDDATGALGAYWHTAAGTASDKPGTSSSSFGAGVAGAVISWQTASINRVRLVRGRTFLVPISSGQYDPDGTLTPACKAALQTAGDYLVGASAGFGVWSRPRGGIGGLFAPAISAHINDRAAFLSSRRG